MEINVLVMVIQVSLCIKDSAKGEISTQQTQFDKGHTGGFKLILFEWNSVARGKSQMADCVVVYHFSMQ